MSLAQPHGDRRHIFAPGHGEVPSSALNFLPPDSLPAEPVSPIQQVFASRLVASSTLLGTATVFVVRLFSDFVWSFELVVLIGLVVLAGIMGSALSTATLFRRATPPLGQQRPEITAIDLPMLILTTFAITLTDIPLVSFLLFLVALATAKRIATSLFEFSVLHLANQPHFHPETSLKWMEAADDIGRRKLQIPTFRPEQSLSAGDRRLHRQALRVFNSVRWFQLKVAALILVSAIAAHLSAGEHFLTVKLQTTAYLALSLLAFGVIRNAPWPSSVATLVYTLCRWLSYVDLPDVAPTYLARVKSIAVNRKLLVVFFMLTLVACLQPLACYFPATLITGDTAKWEEIEPKLIKGSELTVDDALGGSPLGWFPYCCFGMLSGDSFFFHTLLLSILLSFFVPVLFAALVLWAYIGPALGAANAVLLGDSYESGHQPPSV